MQNAKANKQAHRSVVVTEHDKQMTANYANTAVSKDGKVLLQRSTFIVYK